MDSQAIKELIRDKTDIAEVIGEYVQLKPAGSGSMKGLCPFHAERTPSFNVSRERQIFKCFGCDKGGDVFSFLMEMEGLTFPEALRELGKRAGVEVPDKIENSGVRDKADRLIEINELAAKFYHSVLTGAQVGAQAREYVEYRKIPAELVATFRLGAAPDAWDLLSVALKKRGVSDDELIEAGLSLKRKSGSGVVDRFRNRLMIPLCDARGRVVGFTARSLPGYDDGPKYMNSPETLVYKKGKMVFGLHLAKHAARVSGDIIIVEGNLDVVSSHKANVQNVVAASGTALTEDQLRILSRYADKFVFCLDDDAAGFAAAKRALELALSLQKRSEFAHLEIRAIAIPSGVAKDPDELIQKDPAAWEKLAHESVTMIEYVFRKTVEQFDRAGESTIDARRKLVAAILPHLARLGRPDEQDLYLLRLSDVTHVEKDTLRSMLVAERQKVGEGVAAPVPRPVPTPTKLTSDKFTRAAARLLAISLWDVSLTPQIIGTVPLEILPDPWGDLYRTLEVVYTPDESSTPRESQSSLFSRLRTELVRADLHPAVQLLDGVMLRADELLASLSHDKLAEDVRTNLQVFTAELSRKKRAELEAAIRAAELAGDNERLAALMRDYQLVLKASA